MERGSFNSRIDDAGGNVPSMRCGPIRASRKPLTDVLRSEEQIRRRPCCLY